MHKVSNITVRINYLDKFRPPFRIYNYPYYSTVIASVYKITL